MAQQSDQRRGVAMTAAERLAAVLEAHIDELAQAKFDRRRGGAGEAVSGGRGGRPIESRRGWQRRQ
ncbi:MAG TPA: hypothetical protein VNB91_03935 [Jatrophihabitantaceae bacterium]|jgi:hypothetical protein|nr:hypothetical protein [Jatrophihabitantaceae bacterium]